MHRVTYRRIHLDLGAKTRNFLPRVTWILVNGWGAWTPSFAAKTPRFENVIRPYGASVTITIQDGQRHLAGQLFIDSRVDWLMFRMEPRRSKQPVSAAAAAVQPMYINTDTDTQIVTQRTSTHRHRWGGLDQFQTPLINFAGISSRSGVHRPACSKV